ncbi:hypothetical protein M1349_04430 [Patescibacteria group bacterium]|nr:hypothetical protein [Patescibacteria group bacterium]
MSYSLAQTPTPTSAPDTSEKAKQLQEKIKEYEAKVKDLQGQVKTLSSQIAVMDNQIKLTQYRIDSVKEQLLNLSVDIDTATKKINNLEKDLSGLTQVLINRIVATYKVGSAQSFEVLVASNNMSNFFTRLNYLRIAQAHDKKLIYDTQQAKIDYANQKNIFEEKKSKVELLKKELEGYTLQLDQEKKSRQKLLQVTQNDEENYQDMLARARAEYQAILGISAGYGSETEMGDTREGERIASIISGVSACSSGTHLHFEVHNNGGTVSPTGYLSSQDVNWDLGCFNGSCDGSFGFSGSWRWPINGKPTITQGFGMTAYARTGAYGGASHTGIDIVSDDLSVISVKDGKLYRGSIRCGGGYLRYVKVKQADGIDSLYLHVNY